MPPFRLQLPVNDPALSFHRTRFAIAIVSVCCRLWVAGKYCPECDRNAKGRFDEARWWCSSDDGREGLVKASEGKVT